MGAWAYPGDDPGILLFTRALEHGAALPIRPGQRVLEIGCCEEDWLERAAGVWPDTMFVGIDWRADLVQTPNRRTIRADALQADVFYDHAFDAIVSLSAIEHFGLGHYTSDPKDADGDTRIMENAYRWLKPGGWMYLDVPWNPAGYAVRGTEYRTYDDLALSRRLLTRPWTVTWKAYVDAAMSGGAGSAMQPLAQVPTYAPDDRLRYYVALALRKP